MKSETGITLRLEVIIDRSTTAGEIATNLLDTAKFLAQLDLKNDEHIAIIEMGRAGLAKMAIDAPYLHSKFGRLPQFAFIKSELEAICWRLYDITRYPTMGRADEVYDQVLDRLTELVLILTGQVPDGQ